MRKPLKMQKGQTFAFQQDRKKGADYHCLGPERIKPLLNPS